MWAVVKKEFKSYFYSPIGYVFIGIFLLAFSFSFYLSVWGYRMVNFEYIFYTLPTIMVLAVAIPALTMRSFAEERKSGTEQLLLTSPLSITKIVLGKFIAASLIAVITELCTLIYFIILSFFGTPHITTALVSMFGFLLFVMVFIAFGIFASSITENQIIAIILTMAFFILTWILPEFSSIFQNFSFINLLYNFTLGQIDIADTVTFITFIVMTLLLTILFMQRRKSVR